MRHHSSRKGLLSLAMGLLFTCAAMGQAAAPPANKKAAPAKKPAPAAPTLQLEPKALDILKATSDKLAAARTLSFTAVELFEHLTRQGALRSATPQSTKSPCSGLTSCACSNLRMALPTAFITMASR